MANFTIGLKVVENKSQISELILNEIKEEMNEVLSQSAKSIQNNIRVLFQDRIESNKTWEALHTGSQLTAEFGIPYGTAEGRLKTILSVWLESIIVEYKPLTGKTNLRGGITLGMIDANWSDVIFLPEAFVSTKDGELPWLEWLLTYGDQIIVREFDIIEVNSIRSRSHLAFMVRPKVGMGRWRVPPEFAGSTNNNFVTKILDNLDNDIFNIIDTEIGYRLS